MRSFKRNEDLFGGCGRDEGWRLLAWFKPETGCCYPHRSRAALFHRTDLRTFVIQPIQYE